MRTLKRLFYVGFTIGFILMVAGGAVVWGYLFHISRDLPDHETLARYEPAITSRVHAGDGRLISEYARERRIFTPIEAVPALVKNAFLSAEDKTFYSHRGVDPKGMARGLYLTAKDYLSGVRNLQSGSTITQQVAKVFLLDSDQTITRKSKEILIAFAMEETFEKDEILELYLNEIYLGQRSFGVAAAALTYFDKGLSDLSLEEAAYLAAINKGPNNYHPVRDEARAVGRRNWVIDRMVEDGFVTVEEARRAKAAPLVATLDDFGVKVEAADWYAEEVRRRVVEGFGEESLYSGGLSVRTALDPGMQRIAQTALRDGLVAYDRGRGWRGAPFAVDMNDPDWRGAFADKAEEAKLADWDLALVERVEAEAARLILAGGGFGDLAKEDAVWALPNGEGAAEEGLAAILSPGDLVYVSRKGAGEDGLVFELQQNPEADGAIAALDPRTGRVLALVGGFDFRESQFNRAVQARRQPGSSFKPIVYAAALDHGYTPSSIILDAPFAAAFGSETGLGFYKPSNYTDRFYGPSTLRTGIEQSRNVMTVRLAQDMGMGPIIDYAVKFGVVDDMPNQLAMALGAAETTPLRMAAAYAAFINGGKKVAPVLIDQIQDRRGRVIQTGARASCEGCDAPFDPEAPAPTPTYDRPQAVDPRTAYQIVSMMEGVIERGTGAVAKSIGKPLAGKTGTTNDFRDAWFVGFSPDLVVAIYVGHDDNRTLGFGQGGAAVAAPIFRDFMGPALEGVPAKPFRIPPGVRLIRVDRLTGRLAKPGDADVILEAFKGDEAPPEPEEGEKDDLGGLY